MSALLPPGVFVRVTGTARSPREGIGDLVGRQGTLVATRDYLAMPYLVHIPEPPFPGLSPPGGLTLWFRRDEVALLGAQPRLLP